MHVKKTQLVLLRTKLQALIARQIIIDADNVNTFFVIYFVSDLSEEDELIILDLFSDINTRVLLVPYGKGGLRSQLSLFARLTKEIDTKDFSKVYLSSFDLIAYRYLAIKIGNITTFDDGTGYYGKHSCFSEKNKNLKDILASLLLSIPTRHNFKKHVESHYTLNINMPSVMDGVNIKEINIIESPKRSTSKGCIRVFIGTVIEKQNKTLFESVLDRESISDNDYFIKHPRDKSCVFDNCNALELKGVSAEIILSSLVRKGYSIELVGVYSSVFFNIKSKHIKKIVYIEKDDEKKRYDYDLLGYLEDVEVRYI